MIWLEEASLLPWRRSTTVCLPARTVATASASTEVGRVIGKAPCSGRRAAWRGTPRVCPRVGGEAAVLGPIIGAGARPAAAADRAGPCHFALPGHDASSTEVG